MADEITTVNYTVTSIRDGVYALVGETIGLAFDVVHQMRTDIPELIVLLFLVTIVGRLFRPIIGLFSVVLGIATPE